MTKAIVQLREGRARYMAQARGDKYGLRGYYASMARDANRVLVQLLAIERRMGHA